MSHDEVVTGSGPVYVDGREVGVVSYTIAVTHPVGRRRITASLHGPETVMAAIFESGGTLHLRDGRHWDFVLKSHTGEGGTALDDSGRGFYHGVDPMPP